MSSVRHFNFFAGGVVAALILPQIFREGMFMDGSLYSAVAVNYARGLGTFWQPHFAKDCMVNFHEQPPLLFFLLGSCFKLFGESLLVERCYALLVFILSLLVFLKIWKQLFKTDEQLKDKGWFAALVWIMIPDAPWVVIHNMEENTMGLFVLLSVFFLLKALNPHLSKVNLRQIPSSSFVFACLSALSLTAAFLTKGFPGLFPLCLPGLFLLFDRKAAGGAKRIFAVYAVLLLLLLLMGIGLYNYPPAKDGLGTWLSERVLNSIKNVSNTSSRFELIGFLLQQLIPVFALAAVLFLVSRVKRLQAHRLEKAQRKMALISLLLAVSGSFPLIITREQRGFYLATSYPYYAVALAAFMSPLLQALSPQVWKGGALKFFRTVPWLLLPAVIIVTVVLLPTPKRDPEKNHDLGVLCRKIPHGGMVAIPQSLWEDWDLQTGLVRRNYISLTKDTGRSDFFLIDPPEYTAGDTLGYHRVNWELQRYVVLEKDRAGGK